METIGAQQLSQKLGYPITAGESYYTPGCTLTTRCVFPNAVIPQSAISPVAANLLKYIPTPNQGSFFSTSANNKTLDDDKGSFRVDSNSRLGLITGYYFIDDYTLVSPYANSSLPGFASTNDGRAHMLTLSDTKIIKPTVVNELRLQFMRSVYISGQPDGGLGVSLSSLGFVTGAGTPGIAVQNAAIEGVPPVQLNEYSLGVSVAPESQFNNTYQVIDNFSAVKGSHTMKFGGSTHYDQITGKLQAYNNGQFQFSGTETGNDFADLLLGAPGTYLQGVQLPLHTRTKYVGLFAQDSWRVRPNLTFNYGLRWEVSSPWYEANNELETMVPGLQSQVFPGAPTGWVFPGRPRNSQNAGTPSDTIISLPGLVWRIHPTGTPACSVS